MISSTLSSYSGESAPKVELNITFRISKVGHLDSLNATLSVVVLVTLLEPFDHSVELNIAQCKCHDKYKRHFADIYYVYCENTLLTYSKQIPGSHSRWIPPHLYFCNNFFLCEFRLAMLIAPFSPYEM